MKVRANVAKVHTATFMTELFKCISGQRARRTAALSLIMKLAKGERVRKAQATHHKNATYIHYRTKGEIPIFRRAKSRIQA